MQRKDKVDIKSLTDNDCKLWSHIFHLAIVLHHLMNKKITKIKGSNGEVQQTSISASRFLSSSSSFLVTAEESILSTAVLDIVETPDPISELKDLASLERMASLSCDSRLLSFAYIMKGHLKKQPCRHEISWSGEQNYGCVPSLMINLNQVHFSQFYFHYMHTNIHRERHT